MSFLGHYSEQGPSTVSIEKLPAKDAMAPIVLSFEVGKDISTSLLTLTRLDLRGVGSLLAVRSSSRSTGGTDGSGSMGSTNSSRSMHRRCGLWCMGWM